MNTQTQHTVEKIGGTSMSQYRQVRDNILVGNRQGDELYQRIFVVSAYGGVTDLLLEHKKTGEPGVYALFANAESDWAWGDAPTQVSERLCEINADLFEDRFLVALTGWREPELLSFEEKIRTAFETIDLSRELPIVTGYTRCSEGLIRTYDRGYSEITFSKIATVTGAREAIIHKEYHLSSADPKVVDSEKVVPIGRTNYDVTDQLANLGMEAIHPRAAKGLRQLGIPLRVRNTFEPDHQGTLIDNEYRSATPCAEIIAGRKRVFALELFDQDMVGASGYDRRVLMILERFRTKIITKDINANTITHFVDANLKTVKRVAKALEEEFPNAQVNIAKVAIVSAIGSDMQIPGILAQTVMALANEQISVLALHQSMRQVDMQFVIDEDRYEDAIAALHRCLIEPHNHQYAICAA